MVLCTPPLASSLRLHAMARSPFFYLLSSFRMHGKRDSINYSGICARSVSSVVESSEFECDVPQDDVKVTEKDNALRVALSQLSGEFCRESRLSFQRFFSSRHAPVISTGSLKLDLALGIGGLPKGRVVEIYGQEASGKTTLALHIVKEAQKLGGYCAYLDVENALDPSLAEAMGVDTEKLLISSPGSAESLLSMVNTLTKSGSIDVIVVDSVAALLPKVEVDVPLGGIHHDLQSKIMTQALRKIHSSLCQSGTVLIFINQVRFHARPGQGYGNMEEVTSGGNALKFYAAVRLKIIRRRLLKTEDKVTGLGVCVQVVKNKMAPAMKTAEVGIKFGRGFCSESEVFELACEHGVILEDGSNYFVEDKVFNNKRAAEQYLAENSEILANVVMMLRRQLFEQKN